jgi:hypothetical protein
MFTRLSFAVPFLFTVRFLIGTFIKPCIQFAFYFYYKFIKRTDYLRPLPKCKSRLLTRPAHTLAQMIRNKKVPKIL